MERNGASFGAPALIAVSAFMCAVWTLFPIRASAQWSQLVPVNPQTALDDWTPQLVLAPNDRPMIIWMGIDPNEGDEEAYYSSWTGTGWSDASTIGPPNTLDDRFPATTCARDGTPWVLWQVAMPSGAYSGLASHWSSTGWSAPDTIWEGGGRYDNTALAAVSISDAWFARDVPGTVSGDRDIGVYHLSDGKLDPELRFFDPGSIDSNPLLVVDHLGSVTVAWTKIPPLDPPRSRMAFARNDGTGWGTPQSLPTPLGINRTGLLFGEPNDVWITCIGSDPETGPFSTAVWAMRWTGSSWSTPERISRPTANPDSILYQLSGGVNCVGAPSVVWLRGNLVNYTRRDVVMASWAGSYWSPDEIVGDLADSTGFPMWPAIASDNAGTWVAYMRPASPQSSTKKIFSLQRPNFPTPVSWSDFDVNMEGSARRLVWRISGYRPDGTVTIARVEGVSILREPPPELRPITIFTGTVGSGYGATTDFGPVASTVTYWLGISEMPGNIDWRGPRSIGPVPDSGAWTASPNPTDGSVRFESRLARVPQIHIFDSRGRLISVVRPGPDGAGRLVARWSGRNAGGVRVPSGVYYARISDVTGQSRVLRIVLLR